MRFAACIEYDGSAFHGWQAQEYDCRTVQAEVEKGLSIVANHEVKVTCSGRTDAGVHAYNQIIHFDSDSVRSERSWILGANTNMDRDVSLVWIKEADPEFNARYSALSRTYRYTIMQRMVRGALDRDRACWICRKLNIDLMKEASQYLLGENDFTSFRAAGCQARTPFRNVISIDISEEGSYIHLDIRANAFLHHMVRNIVGTLLEVGYEKRLPIWVKEVLEAKDRKEAGVTAPPQGLYFMDVEYPDNLFKKLSSSPNIL